MKKAALILLNLAALNYLYSANLKDMSKIIDLSGRTFGDFQIISFSHKNKYHDALWLCRCIRCNNDKLIIGSSLSNGRRTHCFCNHFNLKHGDSRKTKEYRAYRHMLNRCFNQNVKEYKNYGGRGITVCERWVNSYESFLADVGRAPSPQHSIDRIDVNGDYEPSNCKWSTLVEQANNTRRTYMVEYKGNKLPLGLFCRQFNLPIELIRGRLNNGWDIERAMTTPNSNHKQI